MLRLALLVTGLAVLLPASAHAQVRALAADRHVVEGPALVDGRVLYADPAARRAVRVYAQPAAGGASTEIARVPGESLLEFDAAPAGLALRVDRRLWAGAGPLGLVQRNAPAGAAMAVEEDLFAVPGGPLVLERTDRYGARLRAVLRPPGRPARRAPLPARADLHHVAVAGALAAVRSGEEIVVVELPSGTVRRRLPLGDFAGATLLGLAVSERGDVALTAEGGSGADYLGWAPAGAAEPRVVLGGDEFGLVATAGGRIAMQQPAVRGDGTRIVVLDPDGGTLFRGPPASGLLSLDFDGTHVAWATDGCQFVARADRSSSTARVPAGPCVRTEAAFTGFNDGLPTGTPPRVPIRVRCLTAPGRACRIDLRVYSNRLGRIGRRVVRVPLGRSRLVRIRVSRRPRLAVTIGRVVDPDGRRRIAVLL